MKDLGYVQPTVVQLKAIPLALPGARSHAVQRKFMDLMVSSQTGSGKTAAFLLPVLHTLLRQQAEQIEAERAVGTTRAPCASPAKGEPLPSGQAQGPHQSPPFQAAVPGALVLCPTRELASRWPRRHRPGRHCRGLRIANVVGGMPYQLQIAKLQNANLVVATPGRLLDLQRSMQIKLDQVQFLVVDEADRMLDLGFSDDLAKSTSSPAQRKQTMMFSATFAPRIQQLAMRVMHERPTCRKPSTTRKKSTPTSSRCCSGPTTPPQAQAPGPLAARRIHQPGHRFASTQIECDGSPTICNKRASMPWPCTVPEPGSAQPPPDGSAQRSGCRFWWPPTWPPVVSTCPPSPMYSTTACHEGRKTIRTALVAQVVQDATVWPSPLPSSAIVVASSTSGLYPPALQVGRVAGSGARASAFPAKPGTGASFGGRGKHFNERPARSDRGLATVRPPAGRGRRAPGADGYANVSRELGFGGHQNASHAGERRNFARTDAAPSWPSCKGRPCQTWRHGAEALFPKVPKAAPAAKERVRLPGAPFGAAHLAVAAGQFHEQARMVPVGKSVLNAIGIQLFKQARDGGFKNPISCAVARALRKSFSWTDMRPVARSPDPPCVDHALAGSGCRKTAGDGFPHFGHVGATAFAQQQGFSDDADRCAHNHLVGKFGQLASTSGAHVLGVPQCLQEG